MLTREQENKARIWYSHHREHVNKMMGSGARFEPTGSDADRPELWKDGHWRWFMVRQVEKQILS